MYLVPPSSSRARRAAELVEEIGKDVARFRLEGRVILAGDWNCKIGRLESAVRGIVYERVCLNYRVDEC